MKNLLPVDSASVFVLIRKSLPIETLKAIAIVFISIAFAGCGNPTHEFENQIKALNPHFTSRTSDGRVINYSVTFGKYDVRKTDSTISPLVAEMFVLVTHDDGISHSFSVILDWTNKKWVIDEVKIDDLERMTNDSADRVKDCIETEDGLRAWLEQCFVRS